MCAGFAAYIRVRLRCFRFFSIHNSTGDLYLFRIPWKSPSCRYLFYGDINIAFDGSIRIAELVGVYSKKILRNQEYVYNYFAM